jgi:hypothetical protein
VSVTGPAFYLGYLVCCFYEYAPGWIPVLQVNFDSYGTYTATFDWDSNTGGYELQAMSWTLSTPEPATLSLFAIGLLGIAGLRRRRPNQPRLAKSPKASDEGKARLRVAA